MRKKITSGRKYKEWMWVKDELQTNGRLRNFKEWQVWWCAVGENVGIEINGKNARFSRPMIVFKKFNRMGFMGIPLTTQDHTESSPDWYVHFKLKSKDEYAALHQARAVSSFRLYRMIGTLDDEDIKKIAKGFNDLYTKKMPPLRKRGRVGKSQTYLHYKRFLRKMQDKLLKMVRWSDIM